MMVLGMSVERYKVFRRTVQYPAAAHAHCRSRTVNLAIVHSTKIPVVHNNLNTVQEIASLQPPQNTYSAYWAIVAARNTSKHYLIPACLSMICAYLLFYWVCLALPRLQAQNLLHDKLPLLTDSLCQKIKEDNGGPLLTLLFTSITDICQVLKLSADFYTNINMKTDIRLSGLALMNIHRDIGIDAQAVQEFDSTGRSRMNFKYDKQSFQIVQMR